MKILIRNADSVVIYAEENLTLTNKGAAGAGWFDPNFTDRNATLERAKIPDDFVGGAWTYSKDAWAVVDQARVDKVGLEAAKVKAQAVRSARRASLDTLTVTTAAGRTHAADPAGQARMVAAIVALQNGAGPRIKWRLADDTTMQANAAELIEALKLAVEAQADL